MLKEKDIFSLRLTQGVLPDNFKDAGWCWWTRYTSQMINWMLTTIGRSVIFPSKIVADKLANYVYNN